MNGAKTILIILFTFLAHQSYSQQIQPLVFSGGKNFVGKDVIQLEYGINGERQIDLASTTQQISQYALIKYGITQDLHFTFSYNFARQNVFVSDQMRRTNGLSNITAGFKKKLSKNFSLKSDLGLSKNDQGVTEASFQILTISEHNIDSYMAWENNLGVNWGYNSAEPNLTYLSGITFTVPYPLDIIVEYYGQYGQSAWNNYGNLGLGYYFNKDLMLEAYVGFGSTNDQPNRFISLNFYWRLVPAKYYEE